MRRDTDTADAAGPAGPAAPRTALAADTEARLSLGSRLALTLAARVRIGGFDVTTPEGVRRRFTGATAGPTGRVTINRPRLARRVLTGGNIALGEAYMDGDFDSPDLATFLTVGALNSAALDDVLAGSALYRGLQRLAHARNRNSRSGSRRNIARHYDLGNDFYGLWLDPTMTYSAGLFDDTHRTLETAQANKYAAMLEALDARPGEHILEIGCGWGGFAEYAARMRGCRVTAVTISRAQHDYARARIQEAGLGELVEIRLCDYRDLAGQYDHVASIEMFEAVGERYWPTFFAALRDRLTPQGTAVLQTITIADRHFAYYRAKPDFIQRYIFPGGMLPSPGAIHRESSAAGLSVRHMEAFGDSYAATLADWSRRFQAAWPAIAGMGFDTRFKRMWDYYLAYCEAGFRAGTIDVQRVRLARG